MAWCGITMTLWQVYRAKDNETDRIVALKQIKMGKDGAEGDGPGEGPGEGIVRIKMAKDLCED